MQRLRSGRLSPLTQSRRFEAESRRDGMRGRGEMFPGQCGEGGGGRRRRGRLHHQLVDLIQGNSRMTWTFVDAFLSSC